MACCCVQPATESESVIVSPVTAQPQASAPKEEPYKPPPPAAAPAPEPVKEAPKPAPAPTPAPEAVTEFTINLNKSGGQSLGLNLVHSEDKSFFFIEEVTSGLVSDSNKQSDSTKQVCVGDIIAKVNGATGTAMMDPLSTGSALELLIKKSTEVTLSIKKDGPLGLDLMYQDPKEYLIVKGILDGACKNHNASAAADQQLKAPSRILAVNGTRGKGSELFKQIQGASGSVSLTVCQLV